MTDLSNYLPTLLIVLIPVLAAWLTVHYTVSGKNKAHVAISTIVYLILPALSLYGLYLLTNFIFNAVPETWKPAEPWQSSLDTVKAWSTQGLVPGTYKVQLTAAQLQAIRVALVALWVLLPLLLLNWVGKAFHLWCLF
jgi:hypothetical protein